MKIRPRLDYEKHSYFCQIWETWNEQPEFTVVNAPVEVD